MILVALAACHLDGASVVASDPPHLFDPPPFAAAPPPITLEVSPLAGTVPVTFTVRNVTSGEVAYIAWTHWGPGPGRCPVQLQGACLGVVGHHDLGPAIADASGTATVTQTWLDPAPAFSTVWAQAAVLRVDGSVALSEVVERPVFAVPDVWVGDAILADTAGVAALAGYRAVTGDVVVESTLLASLSLPDVEAIGGDLRVWENDSLTSWSLPSLRTVGGDLSVYANPALTSLVGVDALTSVGGTVSINRNEGLGDLAGLGALETIGATLYVFHETGLTSLDGLSALSQVVLSVELFELYALERATFPALAEIGTRLDVFDSDALTALEFPALTTMQGYELHNCDAMTDVGTFPVLTAMPGQVTVQYANSLTSLSGFSGVSTIGGAVVRFAPALQSVAGLTNLTDVAGTLEFDHLAGLTALDLPALVQAGTLVVASNDALVDPGLPALTTLDVGATVVNNPALSQCALDALFDRVLPPTVSCGANLDDGCTTWCLVDTGP